MKTNRLIASLMLCFCSFVLFVSAQEINSYKNAPRREKRSIPKVLPTELQSNYDVKWYFLNLQAENNTVALTGDVTIKAEITAPVLDTFSFHLHRVYEIDSLKINGVLKPYKNNGDERWVTNLSFPAGEVIDVQIFYHGAMSSSGGFFSGISSDIEPTYGFSVTWTLSEPNNAYEWFPVKQSLTDKADSIWVFVTTSDINKVGSNGLLTNTVSLPNNKVRYEWKSRYPIDYYLISIAVANYQDYAIYATIPQTQQQVLIQNYIYNTPSCLEANKTNIDKIKDMLELYSELFGPYPFSDEKYGKCLAPMGGGMEHQTMTTQISFDQWLSAHELTHQWFGDNITCASWEYIWLNEGFATYGELLWNEYVMGKELAFSYFYETEIKYVLQYGRTGSVYVPKQYMDNEDRIFSGVLSYSKGGCIIHILRFMLDDDAVFFNILQTYQERFSGRTAVAEDFIQIAEELSGKDFTDFLNQWFYGEGYPSFRITWKQSGNQLSFSSVQTTSTTVTPLFNMPFELKINYLDNTSEIVRFDQTENTQQYTYTVPEGLTIKDINFDPNRWLLANGRVIHDTTPVSELDETLFSIYPNPAEDLVTLCFANSDHKKEIKITDIAGKTMFVETIHSENVYDLDISSLQSGIYIIKITSEGQTISQKLVKK